MSRAALPAGRVVRAALLCLAFAGLVTAQTQSPPALTGKVTSHAEGAMEGVLVGATKAGSTIATWVVTNAQGNTAFRAKGWNQAHTRFASGRWDMSCKARPSM